MARCQQNQQFKQKLILLNICNELKRQMERDSRRNRQIEKIKLKWQLTTTNEKQVPVGREIEKNKENKEDRI